MVNFETYGYTQGHMYNGEEGNGGAQSHEGKQIKISPAKGNTLLWGGTVKKISIFFLLVLLAAVAYADNVSIYGTIKDDLTNQAIQNSLVSLFRNTAYYS